MRKDELQHISDSLLIERFARREQDITKHAGLFESLNLNSIGSVIKDFVRRNVSSDAPGGIAGSLINLIVTGALFRVNPLLGGAAVMANLLGFDITGVAMKIAEKVKGILDSRGSISISEVNNIGKAAVEAESGMSADDMLYALREAEFKYGLEKKGFIFGNKRRYKEQGLRKVFEELYATGRKGRIRGIIGGLVVWTIKIALIGAGLIAAGTLVSKLLNKEPKDPGRLQEGDKPDMVVNEVSEVPTAPPTKLLKDIPPPAPLVNMVGPKPSGAGTKEFKNDANNVWYVPAVGGDAFGTLASWTQEIYPTLQLDEVVLSSTPSFMRVVNMFGSPRQGYLAVPEDLTQGLASRKQVVDKFVKDLA